MKRWKVILGFAVSLAGFVGAPCFAGKPTPAPAAPTFVSETSWAYSSDGGNSDIRGIGFDGTFYYIADWTGNSGIGIYRVEKRKGTKTLLIQIYEPNGIALDGNFLWTTQYSNVILEYDIFGGGLVRSIPVWGLGSLIVRLDYDSSSQTFWVSCYNSQYLYQVNLNGDVINSFPVTGMGVCKNVALDGAGAIWVASSEGDSISGGADNPIHILRKYSVAPNSLGVLLKEYTNFTTGWYGMCTNINNRGDGFYQDDLPVLNPATGLYDQHIEKWIVK